MGERLLVIVPTVVYVAGLALTAVVADGPGSGARADRPVAPESADADHR
ncbi:hypothetical protein AB0E62_10175 [Streptomyces sp. NPDC038707]